MTPADEQTPDETPEAEAAATEEKPKPKRAPAKKAATAKKPAAEPDEAPETDEAPAREATADEPKAKPAAKPQPAATPSTNGAPVVRAHAKYVRTSARKARLVCDHIRGKSVTEARAILAHTPRAVARDWSKLLESAVANAEHNHELLGDDLKILSVIADEGPTLKRFQPRAMGRASRIRKRTSHLSIALTPKES